MAGTVTRRNSTPILDTSQTNVRDAKGGKNLLKARSLESSRLGVASKRLTWQMMRDDAGTLSHPGTVNLGSGVHCAVAVSQRLRRRVRSSLLNSWPRTTHFPVWRLLLEAPIGQAVAMRWTVFVAACLLTGALLLPYDEAAPVVAWMLLAGLIQCVRALTRRPDRRHE